MKFTGCIIVGEGKKLFPRISHKSVIPKIRNFITTVFIFVVAFGCF